MSRAVAAVFLWLASPAVAEPLIALEAPAAGSTVGGADGLAFVAGRATDPAARQLDIVLVVETSESTREPSGADIDGDGTTEADGAMASLVGGGDAGDTVLAAELAACRALLDRLNATTTRVGVVAFAGDGNPRTPDSITAAPLTFDYEKVRSALDTLRAAGPKGKTNLVSALNLATIELLGTPSAYSAKREGARRVILFLTDGQLTLPVENSRLQNAKLVAQQAERLAKLDIRVDAFGLGKEALTEPVAAAELARVTNGVFTPVGDLATLGDALAKANLSGVEQLEIRNRTTGQPAAKLLRRPDGFFAALVPMRDGANALEVVPSPGKAATLTVSYSGSAGEVLPPRLAELRDALRSSPLPQVGARSAAP